MHAHIIAEKCMLITSILSKVAFSHDKIFFSDFDFLRMSITVDYGMSYLQACKPCFLKLCFLLMTFQVNKIEI